MKNLMILILSLCVLVSCKSNDDEDCANFIPAPQEFFFTITDSDGNILIGTNAQYPANEIVLLDDNNENAIFEDASDDTRVGLRYYNMESQQPYNLQLGQEEDVLILNIELGECGSRRVKDLIYNNTTYQSNEIGFFTLIKN